MVYGNLYSQKNFNKYGCVKIPITYFRFHLFMGALDL